MASCPWYAQREEYAVKLWFLMLVSSGLISSSGYKWSKLEKNQSAYVRFQQRKYLRKMTPRTTNTIDLSQKTTSSFVLTFNSMFRICSRPISLSSPSSIGHWSYSSRIYCIKSNCEGMPFPKASIGIEYKLITFTTASNTLLLSHNRIKTSL